MKVKKLFKQFNYLLILITFLFYFQKVKAQDNFYNINTIQKIEIYFEQPNWDYRMDTAKAGEDEYILAIKVIINGVQFDSVGVKYKGNSSYDSTYKKNPLHIALDEFKEHAYQGYEDIKLANCFNDPSMIRDVLSYDILKFYMECPRANFAQVYINDSYIGLYSNTEPINKKFCSRYFNSSNNIFISCTPIIYPGPTTKSNLKYIPSADSASYFNLYEIKSKYGWNELVALCDSVTNHSENINSVLDMDRVIWMLAFNNLLVNLDSYSGVFSQNYYLYKDYNNRFIPIVWDLNMCFGGFPHAGNLNTGMGSLTVGDMQKLPLAHHANDPYWPLINIVMKDSTFKKKYIAHIRTLTNEIFINGYYLTFAEYLQTLIDSSVQADTSKFFTYEQFQTALTENVKVGSYAVPGIHTLMEERVNYLQSTSDFKYIQPAISNITISNSLPSINETIVINAQVLNANKVYLAMRFDSSKIFTHISMYDDGQHNDGLAGDNVFGASFNMDSVQAQFYFYAENSNSAIFSPERAEHEFFTLDCNTDIKENSIESNIVNVYPNPADDCLNIVSNNPELINIEIINIFGNIIYKTNFYNSVKVDTRQLPEGMYFIRSNSLFEKILIIH